MHFELLLEMVQNRGRERCHGQRQLGLDGWSVVKGQMKSEVKLRLGRSGSEISGVQVAPSQINHLHDISHRPRVILLLSIGRRSTVEVQTMKICFKDRNAFWKMLTAARPPNFHYS